MPNRISKEKEDEIIQMYLNGYQYSKIMEKCGVSESTIWNVLIRNDVNRSHKGLNKNGGKGKGRVLTESQENEIIDLYRTGKYSQKLLAERFSCSYFVIKNCLKRHNIETIKHFHHTNTEVYEDFFEKIDSEYKAYFLGFIFGDGCINKNTLSIEINERDIDLLYVFKKVTNSNGKISFRHRKTGNIVSTRITSEKMCSDLAKYGIVQNKTYVTKHLPYEYIPDFLLRHFVRGLIDSDGWITSTKNKRYIIGFVTNYKQVAQEFQNCCYKLLPKDTPQTNHLTRKGKKGHSGWVSQFQNQKVVRQLATVVYKDNSVCLIRKYERAKHIYDLKEDNDIV